MNNSYTKESQVKGTGTPLQISGMRGSLTDLRHISNEQSPRNVQGVEEGLIDRLSKTTERLQTDLENLRKNNEENLRVTYV